jgi:hypothetical protein
MNLTVDQLYSLASSVGFPDPETAAAIAMAESRGNPNATAIVTDPLPGNGPERSFGLWQINTLAHPQYDEGQLLDPTYNAKAALAVSSGGTNFTPWSTYNHGDYEQYMGSGPSPTTILPSTKKRILISAAVATVIVGGLVVAERYGLIRNNHPLLRARAKIRHALRLA